MTEKKDKEYYLAKLKKWDNLYYNEGNPEVTDLEYDLVRENFKVLYPDNPYFKEIGIPVSTTTINSKYEEINLPFIMGGLDKVDFQNVEQWVRKSNDDIVISEKLDGNSAICSWKNGELSFSASRGDGEKGQNILNKIKYCIPENIKLNINITLRAEILLEGNLYKELGFKNRRNAVAGMIRRDDINLENLKKLSVIFYEIVDYDKLINDEVERLLFIDNELKLRTVRFNIMKANEITADRLANLLKIYKENSPYDIDGLVLTRRHSERENVSYPKNKVKFKVNEDSKRCLVNKDIEWNVTRLGYVKPVILIEPTEIMGVTVSRVTGFNYNFIEKHQIGKGSEIGVVRSGDVIPYVTEIFKNSTNVKIPEYCPSCNSKLRKTNIDVICDNDNCLQKKIYNVSHFFIKIGCDNISDRTIEMMGVYSVEDAYNMTTEELIKLPGFAKRKADMVVQEIKKSLYIEPYKLLAAFGIPMIGNTVSKSLCSRFTLDELFEIVNNKISYETPSDSHNYILGLGPITTKTFFENIQKYKPLYEFLKKKGLKFIEDDKGMKTLDGVKFALTGAGSLKRKDYISMCELKGGIVKGMSKDTNYLVTDDVSTNSDKIKSANKYGTKIITYEQFMEMIK